MTSTTDYKLWFEDNEPDDFDDQLSLMAAIEGESSGLFERTEGNGKIFIKGPASTLVVVSPKQMKAFRAHVDAKMPAPELGWHGEDMYQRAMAKDD